MVKFILQTVILISLGIILYLAARTLPRISEEDTSAASTPQPHRFTIHLEKIDEWLKFFLEKFLRRMRVLIMKIDNIVSGWLNRFKKEPQKEAGFGGEDKKENGGSDAVNQI